MNTIQEDSAQMIKTASQLSFQVESIQQIKEQHVSNDIQNLLKLTQIADHLQKGEQKNSKQEQDYLSKEKSSLQDQDFAKEKLRQQYLHIVHQDQLKEQTKQNAQLHLMTADNHLQIAKQNPQIADKHLELAQKHLQKAVKNLTASPIRQETLNHDEQESLLDLSYEIVQLPTDSISVKPNQSQSQILDMKNIIRQQMNSVLETSEEKEKRQELYDKILKRSPIDFFNNNSSSRMKRDWEFVSQSLEHMCVHTLDFEMTAQEKQWHLTIKGFTQKQLLYLVRKLQLKEMPTYS